MGYYRCEFHVNSKHFQIVISPLAVWVEMPAEYSEQVVWAEQIQSRHKPCVDVPSTWPASALQPSVSAVSQAAVGSDIKNKKILKRPSPFIPESSEFCPSDCAALPDKISDMEHDTLPLFWTRVSSLCLLSRSASDIYLPVCQKMTRNWARHKITSRKESSKFSQS